MNPFLSNTPNLNSVPARNIPPAIEIGYKITNTAEAQQKALYEAFDLVRNSRRIGLETRTWSNKMDLETQALLQRLNTANIEKDLTEKRAAFHKKMWEMACWENQILAVLRNYMNQTSEYMNLLKPLNPPLTAEHIKPFHEAMMADRRITVDAMEPLTKTISLLTAFKLDLRHREADPVFDYRPAF